MILSGASCIICVMVSATSLSVMANPGRSAPIESARDSMISFSFAVLNTSSSSAFITSLLWLTFRFPV